MLNTSSGDEDCFYISLGSFSFLSICIKLLYSKTKVKNHVMSERTFWVYKEFLLLRIAFLFSGNVNEYNLISYNILMPAARCLPSISHNLSLFYQNPISINQNISSVSWLSLFEMPSSSLRELGFYCFMHTDAEGCLDMGRTDW